MCGFYGIFTDKPLNNKELIVQRKVSKEIKYRGPDFTGEFISKEKNFYSWHHRLSIIDLKKESNQPFRYKNYVILFNGEIYNYKKIKEKLGSKFKFKTNGDTEVLLYSWIKWGKSFSKHIDGMYSFVIYDGKNIYFISDNFLEKPLYYLRLKNRIYFSSEQSILVRNFKLKKKIESDQINSFISLGYMPYQCPVYENLNYLQPSTIVSFNKKFKKREIKYWKKNSLKIKKKKNFQESDRLKLKELIIESIKNRLVADVPIAHFMSSGFDSTLIAAICKKELNYNLHTYTVRTPGNYKEVQNVKKICKYLNLKNKIIDFSYDQNFEKISKKLLNLFYEPNDNVASIMFMQMSKKIRKDGFKVSLCGLGGDELILGYNKYNLINKVYKLSFNDNIFLNKLSYYFKFLIFGDLKEKFDRFIFPNKYEKFLNFRNIANYKNINPSFLIKFKELSFDNNLLNTMYNFDINNTLPLSYNKALDLGSMRASIEVRSPFLNKKIYSFLRTFENDIFFKGTQKKLFRDILLEYLPASLIPEAKIGFNYSLDNIYKSINSKYLNKLLVKNIPFLKNDLKLKKNDKNFEKLIFRLMILNNFLNEKN